MPSNNPPTTPIQRSHIAAANPLTGQIYMIAPNQHQMGVSYFLPRSFLDPTGNGLALAPGTQQRFFAHPTGHQRFQLHPAFTTQPQQNLNLIAPPPALQTTSVIPVSKSSTVERQHSITLESPAKTSCPSTTNQSPRPKANIKRPKQQSRPEKSNQSTDPLPPKINGSKQKCLFHLIEGQLIIETPNPLNESKPKTPKRKDKRKRDTDEISPFQESNKLLDTNSPQPENIIETKSESDQTQVSALDSNCEKNEVDRVRAAMLRWSVTDVVTFIEEHADIRQYASKFAEEEVDGKALLLIIDNSHQSLATMFKLGPAIKVEAALSKYKLPE